MPVVTSIGVMSPTQMERGRKDREQNGLDDRNGKNEGGRDFFVEDRVFVKR